MTASPKPSASIFPLIALAIVALLVGGVFAKEALKHRDDIARIDEKAAQASEKLKAFPFDANGNVPIAKRIDYDILMRQLKVGDHRRHMSDILLKEQLISAGGFLSAAVLLGIAVRRRKAAAS
jgi:hypothetical protein